MGITAQITTFIVLVVALSFLRERLVYELSGSSLLLFHSTKPGIYLYSLLVLPGTILHELSHWLMAEILQVRTGTITVLPELTGQGREERLGSVATAKSDPFRGFFIGVAPFITGIFLLLVLGQLLLTLWDQGAVWWQLALIIYSVMVLGNSMLISRADRATWPFIFLFLLLLLFLRYYFALPLPETLVNSLGRSLMSLNWVLGLTAVFNLVMIASAYAVRRLVEKLSRQRIIRK